MNTREIKFRGMDVNGVMRYGRLSQDKENSTLYYKECSQRICWDNSNIPVTNESLGQYTGLKDKNGTEIYEGDILKITTANMVLSGMGKGIPKKSYDDLHSNLGEVYIEPGMILVRHLPNKSYRGHLVTVIAQSIDSGGNLEVIGNIYENPELLPANSASE